MAPGDAAPAAADAATASGDATPAPADAVPAPADAPTAPADAPTPSADGVAAAGGKLVLEIDAGPEAGRPLDLSKLRTLPADVAKKLCEEARARAMMECEQEDSPECGCTFAAVGPAGARETALLTVTASVIPGVTATLVLMQQDAGAWKPLAQLGQSEGGMRGESGRTATVHHVGAADLGAAGRWVWVDAMQEDYAIDVGTVWTRTLWLCGGSEATACHGVPLKSWWSARVKGLEDLQKEVGLPSQPAELKKFALSVALDEQGVLTISAKTEVPGALAPLIGKHPLASLGGVKGVMPAPPPPEGDDDE
jgi:hypothetical protein